MFPYSDHGDKSFILRMLLSALLGQTPDQFADQELSRMQAGQKRKHKHTHRYKYGESEHTKPGRGICVSHS